MKMPPPLPPLDGGGVGVIFILRCARPGHGFRVAPPLELKRLETIFHRDAPGQRKDLEGDDRHALNMAAFRLPRLLRQPHISKR